MEEKIEKKNQFKLSFTTPPPVGREYNFTIEAESEERAGMILKEELEQIHNRLAVKYSK